MSYVGRVLGAFQIRTDQRLIVLILPGGGSKEQLTKERPRQVTVCLLRVAEGDRKNGHTRHIRGRSGLICGTPVLEHVGCLT